MLTEKQKQYIDERKLIEAALKEINYAIERAASCAKSSWGYEAGEEVAFRIKQLIGNN